MASFNVASSNSAGMTGGNTINVTKPSGLAVGDILVALVSGNASTNLSLNTPSGWTVAISDNDNNNQANSIYYKTADAADVAAAQFTFTHSYAPGEISAAVLRVVVDGQAFAIEATSGGAGGTVSTSIYSGFSDELAIILMGGWGGGTGAKSVTGFTITGATNPSWTTALNAGKDLGTADPVVGGGYAYLTAPQSITSYSASFSAGSSSYRSCFVVFKRVVPEITTQAVSGIAQTTAIGNATGISDYGAVITARGVCWDTNPTPTIANSKTIEGGTTGAFTTNITGLSANTTYYVRAYATNSSGTSYGAQVSFTTLPITSTDIIKDIGATSGTTYLVSVNVTGSAGTVTAKLGTTGTSTVINAGAGVSTFSGTYSGLSGLIFTRSAGFNGSIDDVYYVQAPIGTTVNWALDTLSIITPISSEVFFKRIEEDLFNSFVLYRYLDLLFKDFDGYVLVTLKSEQNDGVTTKSKSFSVGNTGSPASPFSKKRISFLCKDQAIIIGLSNASLNETFAIAKFVLGGHKRPRKLFGADRIISVGD